jgi:hypothetical protein
MSDKPDAPRSTGDRLVIAADRLRDSTKWLVVSLGAVATVVFAGLTISGLGKVSPDTPGHRFQLAIAGAAIAIGGTVLALYTAMRLAGASTTTLADLSDPEGAADPALSTAWDHLRGDPALSTWGGDIDAFLDDYHSAWNRYVQEARALADPQGTAANDPAAAQRAAAELTMMRSVSNRLLSTVSFLRLQYAFEAAGRWIAGLVLGAAVGATLFGWATMSAPTAPATIAEAPQIGVLRPSEDTTKELKRLWSGDDACASSGEVEVIVIDDTAGDGDDLLGVLTVPSDKCRPVALTVPLDEVVAG